MPLPRGGGPFEPNPEPNTWGSSRRHIIRPCDDSLRRLGTDWIDLYQMHRPDYATDVDETLGALSDLIHQGKVRAIGSSTFPAELIVEAQWTAERRGRERFRCEQPPYSIFVRGIERGRAAGLRALRHGRHRVEPAERRLVERQVPARRRGRARSRAAAPAGCPERFDPIEPDNARKLDLVEELDKLAGEAGMSLPHLALAWTLEHPAVTSTIIGPRTMEHLDGAARRPTSTALSAEVLDRIDELVPPGTNVRAGEDPFEGPWLRDATQRRRPA